MPRFGQFCIIGVCLVSLPCRVGAEAQRPLAVVVIGGLVSATLLTMFVLPTLYLAFFTREPHSPVDASAQSAAT